MSYIDTAVLIAICIGILGIISAVLYDIGRDVVHSNQRERKEKREQAKIPNNVVRFSRENRKSSYEAGRKGVR